MIRTSPTRQGVVTGAASLGVIISLAATGIDGVITIIALQRRGGRGEDDQVIAAPSRQEIIVAPSRNCVIAGAAVNCFPAGAAVDEIVAVASAQGAARTPTEQICEDIVTVAGDQNVVTARIGYGVITRAARKPVGTTFPTDDVVTGAAEDRVPRVSGALTSDQVLAFATVENAVTAVTAGDDVIAGTASDPVSAADADQGIVTQAAGNIVNFSGPRVGIIVGTAGDGVIATSPRQDVGIGCAGVIFISRGSDPHDHFAPTIQTCFFGSQSVDTIKIDYANRSSERGHGRRSRGGIKRRKKGAIILP